MSLGIIRILWKNTWKVCFFDMEISIEQGIYAIGKLRDPNDADGLMQENAFCSVTVTPDEVSVVCRQDKMPPCEELQSGFILLKIVGVLDFSLTGILAKISDILAQAQIPIFCVSTYNTDYVLVRQAFLEKAAQALRRKGIAVSR